MQVPELCQTLQGVLLLGRGCRQRRRGGAPWGGKQRRGWGGGVVRRENQAADSPGTAEGEGGHEASGVELNLVRDHHGLGGGIELSRGNKNHRVEGVT